MFKKAAPAVLGVIIVLSPLFVSAETSAELQSRIETLLAQIAGLQAQLQQISGVKDICPNISGSQTSVPAGYQLQNKQCVPITTDNKCGVNTFSVSNGCGFGLYSNANVQCYDGYRETLGGLTSCKPTETWRGYANDVCAKRCSQTKIQVSAPNGGEQWEIGTMNTITWTPYSYNPDVNPSKDVTAYLERKNNEQYITVGTIMPSGKASIHWEGDIDEYGKYPEPGQYYIRIVNNVSGKTDRSDQPFTLTSRPENTITVTAPNGGEKWEIGQLNTITWAPYSYNPDINPSSKVAVYLEQKVGNNTFTVIGRVMDTGKASLHTYFNIDSYDRWPERGEYYVRAVNNTTGASDRSDAPFTLLSKSIDLKVNGSDGGITVSDGQKLFMSWTTANYAFTQCKLSGARLTRGGAITEIPNLPSSGSRTVYAHVSYPGAFTSIGLECATEGGAVKKTDYVSVVSGSVSASITVISPNAGEKIPLDQPYLIRLNQSGLKSLSIALYKNDQWLEWLTKDSTPTETLNWTPMRTTVVNPESGAVYKIYITGLKADGTGYVDDKSDAPFSFVSSPTASFSASPATGTKPLTVTLTGSRRACSARNPVYEEVNRIDFGDGETSNAVPTCGPFSLKHTYSQAGAYTAKLLTAGYGPAPLQWTTLRAATITVKGITSAHTNFKGQNEYFANAFTSFQALLKGFFVNLPQ